MNKLQKGKRIRSFNSNRKNQGKCSTKYLKALKRPNTSNHEEKKPMDLRSDVPLKTLHLVRKGLDIDFLRKISDS